MENIRQDYLPKNLLKIYQHQKMFKINTFSCLLGEFLDFEEDKRVLDIGTNNGVQLIYASLRKPRYLVGIDINNEALEIAKMNLDYHHIANYELLNIEAQNYYSEDKFDVVIANPPFFELNEYTKDVKNNYLLMAKHEKYLGLDDLISCVSRSLNNDGYLYLVHQYFRLNEIINSLRKFNLHPLIITKITNKNKKDPTGVLIKAGFKEEELIYNEIEA